MTRDRKRKMPDFPFFLDRPTPVRDVVLGERRVIGPEGEGLGRLPLGRDSGNEGSGAGILPLGFLKDRPNGIKPLDRLRAFRKGDEDRA